MYTVNAIVCDWRAFRQLLTLSPLLAAEDVVHQPILEKQLDSQKFHSSPWICVVSFNVSCLMLRHFQNVMATQCLMGVHRSKIMPSYVVGSVQIVEFFSKDVRQNNRNRDDQSLPMLALWCKPLSVLFFFGTDSVRALLWFLAETTNIHAWRKIVAFAMYHNISVHLG